MSYNDLSITISTLLTVFGGMSCVIVGITSITKMLNPFRELKKQVERHEQSLRLGNNKFAELDTLLQNQISMQREICKSLIVIMNHDVTGNSKDKVKEQMEELQKFLIDN